MNFLDQLQKTIAKNNSLVCIGLDPDLSKFPKDITDIFKFNKKIIDETKDLVSCYKPNIGFYAAYGQKGQESLQKTVDYIHTFEIPVILDAKRGDLGNTTDHYVKEAFEIIKADAVTINPYMGFDSVEPFLRQKDKGIIILCRTSNPSAADFQDLNVDGEPLYMNVAYKITEWNKKYGNCLMVVGATWPEQLKQIREIAPDMFFLIPGIGVQGGDLEGTLINGLTQKKSGLIINSSRGIIYAENPRQKAIELRDSINKYR